ncbi:ABC transporter substrate-binding protein [Ornithinimicrobium cavernae]|uniref:ABC transporter substrate-binding protein n=1 Tax=Ornithinimicrobium cavernae TaxID=2666047 RepID=UPI000D68C861|nr:ABC transporter substrate-binding protein [Ornithinimicrobium cavernae]
MSRTRTAALSLLAVPALVLAACTSDPEPSTGGAGGGSTGADTDSSTASAAAEVEIPTQELNEDLRSQLPEDVQESGTMVSVNTGSFPPYTIVQGDNEVTGATADLATALEQMLDITIEHTTIDGLASVLQGMDGGRYDLDLGPIGDFPERQEQATFVDYVQEYVVFAVPAGNPAEIEDIASTCGTRIAVQAAGSAERTIKEQSVTCEENGEEPVEVQSYKDQPSSILAVQSGRADAFFSSQAPLTYFVQQSDGELELAGTGEANGFDDLFQGAVVPKDSPTADVLLAAFEELHANGTYDAIMTKWGLEGNTLDTPGINLGQ